MNPRLARRIALSAALCAGPWAGAGAQTADVQAGLERALKTPLEIVWLGALRQAEMWRRLNASVQLPDCAIAGSPRNGCAVAGAAAWRYVFGEHSASVSRLLAAVPRGEEPRWSADPVSGAMTLAPGAVVHLADPAFPAVVVELSAPQDRPLVVDGLADNGIARVIALLLERRAPAEPPAPTLLAAAVALPTLPAMLPAMPVVEKAEPLPADPAVLVEVAERLPNPPTANPAVIVEVAELLPDPAVIVEVAEPLPPPAAAAAPKALAASDLERMRAEVEAEIERDRLRVLASIQAQKARVVFGRL